MLFQGVIGVHKPTPTSTFPTAIFATAAATTTATVVVVVVGGGGGGAMYSMNHNGTLG